MAMKAFLCIVWIIVALVLAVPLFVLGSDVLNESWKFIFGYAIAWTIMAIFLRIIFSIYPGNGIRKNTKAAFFWSGFLVIGISAMFFYKAYITALTGNYLVPLKGYSTKADAIYALINLAGDNFGPYGASVLYILIGGTVAYIGIYCVRRHI
jgi:hypothetical protein